MRTEKRTEKVCVIESPCHVCLSSSVNALHRNQHISDYTALYKSFIIFSSPTSTKLQALNIVISKVSVQRRLIRVKGVEEGECISPLGGYRQLLK